MVGGCRIHCYSRTTPSHALFPGETEIMSISELWKDCTYIHFCFEFCGMGTLPIAKMTEASVARQFVHRKGVGRMNHIDIRCMWLQTVAEQMVYTLTKLPRIQNPSDILTHFPTKNDVDKFLPMFGVYPITVSKGALEIVKKLLRSYSQKEQQIAAMLVMMMARHAEAVRPSSQDLVDESGWSIFHEIYFVVLHLLALIGVVAMLACVMWLRRLLRGNTPVRSLVDTCTRTTPIGLTASHPENISVTTGDCYHVDVSCGALVQARASKKRPCLK